MSCDTNNFYTRMMFAGTADKYLHKSDSIINYDVIDDSNYDIH